MEQLDVSVYRVPTDVPESDGTLEWDHTTIVIVEAMAGGMCGLGYTYADTAAAQFIRDHLVEVVRGRDAMAVSGAWTAMLHAVRNLGRTGVAAMAIAAVDSALWDLKARLLELPLVTLIGAVRDGVPVYGSGGFTSYSAEQLRAQLSDWVARGLPLSAHTAPSLHAHPCCALPAVRHLEYFHDHVRIERMFFEGTPTPANGSLRPDLTRPGMGLVLKRSDAQRYAL